MTANELLRESAPRGARRQALSLLHDVRDVRDRLDDTSDEEALHDFRVALRRLRSWLRAFRPLLRDTLARKAERRLKRIARATGASRDLEVHIAWIEHTRRSVRGQARDGPAWLLDRLHAQKTACDSELRHVIDDEYDRTVECVERGLLHYTASVLEDEAPFAPAFACLVEQHMDGLAEALGRVGSLGDRTEAHAARIAAKRLRYLVEAVADDDPTVDRIIDDLKTLQDNLGELHDAQIFASEIAALEADSLAAEPPAPEPRIAGLRLLSRRLRRRETRAFTAFMSGWAPPKLAVFASNLSEVVVSLKESAP